MTAKKKAKKVRKKPRSAKQKAATRKLVALNRRGSSPKRKAPKRKASKRRASKRKTNKPKKAPKRMAKKGFAAKIPIINNPMFKKAAIGVGSASLAAAVVGIIAPQIAANPIFKPAIALLTGDIIGLGAQVVSQGGIGSITNLLGGGGGSNTNTSSMGGFA